MALGSLAPLRNNDTRCGQRGRAVRAACHPGATLLPAARASGLPDRPRPALVRHRRLIHCGEVLIRVRAVAQPCLTGSSTPRHRGLPGWPGWPGVWTDGLGARPACFLQPAYKPAYRQPAPGWAGEARSVGLSLGVGRIMRRLSSTLLLHQTKGVFHSQNSSTTRYLVLAPHHKIFGIIKII